MDTTFKLNTMYYKLFSKIQPIKTVDLSSAVTTANSAMEAFQLKDPAAFKKQELIVENRDFSTKDLTEQQIIRVYIPYSDAIIASKDLEWGYEYFSVIKNEMLKKIAESGTSYNQLSFLRPGQENLVFRDLENFAGLELRLYSNKLSEGENGTEQQ